MGAQEPPAARPGSGCHPAPGPAAEGFVRLDGQEMYRLADGDLLPPFLMSLVSDSDHWMFISSYGGLTAGRADEDHALFPYETDDRLHLCHGLTGPITLLRVWPDGATSRLWEPFTDRIKPPGNRRNLYKSVLGSTVVFEEVHPSLGLTFRYRWAASEPLGFVRTATLLGREGAAPVRVMAVQVNMEMDGVYHANRRSQGGFIALNGDDDDADQVEDRFQTSGVAEEDNLIKITINQVKPEFLTGEVTLHHNAGNPYGIRIWDNASRSGSPLTLPKTWQTPWELPAFLYVEGYAASEGVRDHELTLAYYINGTYSVFCDFIKITVVDVQTVQVDPIFDQDSYDVPSNIKTGKPKQHFVTVKGEQYITLVATITPDTEEVRNKITWSEMDQDPTNRLRARKTREFDSFYPATVNVCGKTAHQLVNWVVWAYAAPVIRHDYTEHIMAPFTRMGQMLENLPPTDGGCTVSHQIWPPSIITDTDRPDLSGNRPPGTDPPNVPPGDTGVQNQGRPLAGGATKFWDSSRQIRRNTINPDSLAFEGYNYQGNYLRWFTNYPNYPSDEVCGNDDTDVVDEDNDPYYDPHFRDVWGEDGPTRPAYHSYSPSPTFPNWGVEGNTFEVHLHMRSFARLLLGSKWYRISDWTLWRVHFKFKKQLEYEANLLRDFNGDGDWNDTWPVWRNNGTFISTGNDDF